MSGQMLTSAVPVVGPVEARRGRFLVGRRKWDDVVAYAARLDDSLRQRHVTLSGWQVVATYATSTREWQLYAVQVRQP
jgi:hypothetical protein